MTPTIKKIIIAAIILFVIVVSVVVYNKYKQEKAIKDAAAAKAALRAEVAKNTIIEEASVAPKGTLGGKGNPIG